MEVSSTQLTPLLFLERSVEAFPTKAAFLTKGTAHDYRALGERAQRIGQALRASGIESGDRIAYLSPNTFDMLAAHFGVPLIGAVLVAINTRLAPAEVAYILSHSGARMLFVDTALADRVSPILDELETVEEVVLIEEEGPAPDLPGTRYPDFLARASGDPLPWRVADEYQAISINYTSGTTGRPKGVVYTHRGAYLNSLTEIIHSRHSPSSVYLWTLPMFHCNGWCTTWAVTGIGGTHVGLRAVEPAEVWKLIRTLGVTHLNAAPTVLISLANHPDAAPIPHGLTVTTAGAPPSPTIIGEMERLGASIIHVYGLTETYGPHTVCEWQDGWQELGPDERAVRLARQGLAFIGVDPIRVVDGEMNDVPRDGATMGEVVMRGNNVMAGYFDDPEATATAFRGGWFHSGDVAVWHEDGYIELRDRSKDVIVSGGENISTIEVEQAIMEHPAVLEAAVVAIPHDHWGERPKAYVVLKSDAAATEYDIIEHVRARLAHYKAPDHVEFVDALPKTSTGKIQKYVLRERAWTGHGKRIN